mmetsp:Transcript_12290/g.26036  ORF Transcript_12290/g.26036 Transcript_12290/m.26036 type:complete len:341 (+) Transcript_12290:115-1137(+)|eukprot:CAMPEP_0201130352 /NCGR_PEP_ID=MMETSP0850-20130426/39620_1 /ASSEMBLY_ACC=CAM_ASM_000622 /TAXON_ID=183588 /ORGANISM="Pseudo-nitzschia fraudulenta, Strain WWA7" /LENGTH=340 /DNA_ID=CAMNT_0047400099 /DNA_START=44 /DNA_END=1066 /DNA_ORIENTATION=-
MANLRSSGRRPEFFGITMYVLAVTFFFTALNPRTTFVASASSPTSIFSLESGSPLKENRFVRLANEHYERAKGLALIEQKVEDHNARWVAASKDRAEATSKRRLICLPLDERFDPPMGMFSHGHIQTGDKISLPPCFMTTIKENKAEVPWLFKVSRIDGGNGEDVGLTTEERVDVDVVSKGLAAEANLKELVGGPLDCRAPSNYCFMPWWMMRALGLKPLDLVDVQLITIVPPGSMAKFRPHSSDFAKDISNPQAVMETELRHYSSLTKGSSIAFDYNGKRYWFDVEELRAAPKGEKQSMVKVQDCDLATDFLVSKDILKEKKRKLEEARRARQEAEDDY